MHYTKLTRKNSQIFLIVPPPDADYPVSDLGEAAHSCSRSFRLQDMYWYGIEKDTDEPVYMASPVANAHSFKRVGRKALSSRYR
jgi:hypothetical protein